MPGPLKQHPAACGEALCLAADRLRKELHKLRFSAPVAAVYNPLDYAWQAYELYVRRYAVAPVKVLFLGMNPGPFGMVQTGIPFGEVAAVKGWLRIETAVGKPAQEHARRPVLGFDCRRSEVSGRRLWGLFGARFGTAREFFANHFVLNYCPLAFLEESGRNLTPDKLASEEREVLLRLCDRHLREALDVLRPTWAIGVGGFAAGRLEAVAAPAVRRAQILHPSPACPAANRDWAGQVTRHLIGLGVW